MTKLLPGNILRKTLKKIVPEKYLESIYKFMINLFDKYSGRFYSLEGEDVIIRKYFYEVKNGFYVDIGAYHPKKYSNTYYFYKKGWKGINIDAMPDGMKLFKKIRPRDINLELAISDKKEKLTYYGFNESALNGFSDRISTERDSGKEYKIVFKKEMETIALSEVMDKFLPKGQRIDFISVDVEGLDLKVLKSNNWKKYTPSYILVEILNASIKDILNNNIYRFLIDKKYDAIASTGNTTLFKKNKL